MFYNFILVVKSWRNNPKIFPGQRLQTMSEVVKASNQWKIKEKDREINLISYYYWKIKMLYIILQ